MNKLLMAMSISFIGHVIAWFHMQGQFKYEWAKSIERQVRGSAVHNCIHRTGRCCPRLY